MEAAEALEPVPAGTGRGDDPRPGGLTRREHAILAFERQWWKYAGAKEQAVRELFELTPTRYYQVLNDLVDRQDALRADPMLIKRLRRARTGRQRSRSTHGLDVELR